MSFIKKFFSLLFSFILTVIAGVIIWFYWEPISSWYWHYRPVLGVDFYNMSTYVGYLSRHFGWQFNGWKYIWWSGGPLVGDYPLLHAYLILPLLHFFTLPQAVLAYMVICTFLSFFFCYLLFAEIAGERVLALFLAIATSYSLGYYGTLIWAGGLPYYATQLFFPLVLYLLVKFFNSGNKKWLLLSAFTSGLSILGHPQVGYSYLIPVVLIFLVFYPMPKERFFSKEKIKRLFLYFLIAIFSAYPYLGQYFGWSPIEMAASLRDHVVSAAQMSFDLILPKLTPKSASNSTIGKVKQSEKAQQESVKDAASFDKDQINKFYTDIHRIFFPFAAASMILIFVSFVIRKKRLQTLKTLIFAFPAAFVYLLVLANANGIPTNAWYRAFWVEPIAFGIFISFAWGDFWTAVMERIPKLKSIFVLRIALMIFAGVLAGIAGLSFVNKKDASDMITKAESAGYRQQSSAYPEAINYYIEKDKYSDTIKQLVPSWMDPNDTQYRLYDDDQRINIWWNSVFDMPLVKGYVEIYPGDNVMGTYYWSSIAIMSNGGGGDILVKSWDTPPDMAYNNALFLIDWLSIKYLEAEHQRSDSYHTLTSYLSSSDIFSDKGSVTIPGWTQIYQVKDGQPLIWHPKDEENLTFYKVKDQYVSPILHPTNASVVGVIGSLEDYKSIIRYLAAVNLNSRKIIPVRLGKFIDDVSSENLRDMDAVILYGYDYHNYSASWDKLAKFVENGGKVFVDTGNDVKQRESENTPSIFPVTKTKLTDLGTDWDFTDTGSEELANLDTTAFGTPVQDNSPWKFSVPLANTDIRDGAKVILADKGSPLIVSMDLGKGHVIWSGMNLPFFVALQKKMEAAKLMTNLLSELVPMPEVDYGEFQQKRNSPSKVTLTAKNAKGVLFRENSNPGWTASLTSQSLNKGLHIYQTGPTYFGYSYVRIPEKAQDSFSVTFNYWGDYWVYFWQAVWFIIVLSLIDYIFFGSRILIPALNKIRKMVLGKVGKWWEKEEDY